MADCIFCKIVRGEIPSKRIAEDANAIIIEDLHPQARKHYLVIPKKHVDSLDHAFKDEIEGRKIVGDVFALGLEFAKSQPDLLPGGFRSVINTNADGGQTVFHLHLHLLGGEKLKGRFA